MSKSNAHPPPSIQSFEEFWPYYVGEHRLPGCRLAHYIGTTAGLSFLVVTIVFQQPWFLLAALVSGYGPAWVGHFFIEHNRPATFTYPRWSLMADFKMYALMLQGRMRDEVIRLYGTDGSELARGAARS